jgi:hypothetical protein
VVEKLKTSISREEQPLTKISMSLAVSLARTILFVIVAERNVSELSIHETTIGSTYISAQPIEAACETVEGLRQAVVPAQVGQPGCVGNHSGAA